jgi:hypothetical protein
MKLVAWQIHLASVPHVPMPLARYSLAQLCYKLDNGQLAWSRPVIIPSTWPNNDDWRPGSGCAPSRLLQAGMACNLGTQPNQVSRHGGKRVLITYSTCGETLELGDGGAGKGEGDKGGDGLHFRARAWCTAMDAIR